MGFIIHKSWQNKNKDLVSNRTWTRRITWLVDEYDRIKLKLEDRSQYREVLPVHEGAANTIWQRFKDGDQINDCVSFLANEVPISLASRRVVKGK